MSGGSGPEDGRARCDWGGEWGDALMLAYHDAEWGLPLHDDRALFELLILEGAQAGLSWRTVLHRREGYRRAYDGFALEKVARYTSKRQERLVRDAGIIRNRAKVAASVKNAQAALRVREEFGSLEAFLWGFVDGRPRVNRFRRMAQIPAETAESKAMSRALKARGFGFVGPTICYAFMQSAGMVNDHLVSCFRYGDVQTEAPG